MVLVRPDGKPASYYIELADFYYAEGQIGNAKIILGNSYNEGILEHATAKETLKLVLLSNLILYRQKEILAKEATDALIEQLDNLAATGPPVPSIYFDLCYGLALIFWWNGEKDNASFFKSCVITNKRLEMEKRVCKALRRHERVFAAIPGNCNVYSEGFERVLAIWRAHNIVYTISAPTPLRRKPSCFNISALAIICVFGLHGFLIALLKIYSLIIGEA